MQITRDMTIAGVSAIKLRDALMWYGGSPWSADSLSERLNVDEPQGLEIAARLLEEGYIQAEDEDGSAPCYRVTLKGGALALASAAKPIKRATANRLVEGAIRTAQMIEADDRYLFRVTKLLVFGSYLTDCPTLGDVDLAVELGPRVAGKQQDAEAILDYAQRAEQAGRRFPNFLNKLDWPSEEIYRALKGRSRAISIHPVTDPIVETAATRVIYEHA